MQLGSKSVHQGASEGVGDMGSLLLENSTVCFVVFFLPSREQSKKCFQYACLGNSFSIAVSFPSQGDFTGVNVDFVDGKGMVMSQS